MRSRVAGAVWLVVVLLEGCGGSGSSANFPKPPAATSPDTTDHALVPSPAKLNGEPEPQAGAPDAGDVAAMSPEARQKFIDSMVAGLAERLKAKDLISAGVNYGY